MVCGEASHRSTISPLKPIESRKHLDQSHKLSLRMSANGQPLVRKVGAVALLNRESLLFAPRVLLTPQLIAPTPYPTVYASKGSESVTNPNRV